MMSKGMMSALLLGLLWLVAGITPVHAGTKHYYYTDAQGTVLAKADAQGNIVATYDYAPYGKQVLGAPPSGPTGYTGHVNDAESGLVYMQARYYDPVVGRFLSVDPVAPSPGDGFSFNRYSYANSNPITYIDPDGQASRTVATAVRLVSGGLKRVARLTQEQAVALRKSRMAGNTKLEVHADRDQVGKQIERAAAKDPTAVYKDAGSTLKGRSGARGMSHYQTEGEWGHTFVGKLGVIALAASDMLDNVAEATEYIPDIMPRPADRGDLRRWNNITNKINHLTGSNISPIDENEPEEMREYLNRRNENK